MEKISEAILSRVTVDAENIVKEAEEKARAEVEKAKKQRSIELEEEKRKKLEEAEEEAARIIAQASIRSRQKLSSAKADVIAKMVDRVKHELSQLSSDKADVLNLVREAVDGLGRSKVRIYVSPKDAGMVRTSLEKDVELASKVVEVKEFDCTGGVIAEDVDGKYRVDNTYETRLEMLLPKLLPEISKEFFPQT